MKIQSIMFSIPKGPKGDMPAFDVDTVKNEPMLFNNDLDSAFKRGCEVTKAFIDRLPAPWVSSPLVIDTRVHMLMPGWYPCIPGWHHDDVPRTRSDGQPNYGPGQCRSQHIMVLVNGDICPTEFAEGEADFDEPPLGTTIYAKWNDDVNLLVKNRVLRVNKIKSGELTQFNDRTWHRGVPAVANGWRFFARASRYFDADGNVIPRGNPRTNEQRNQVQVYLPAIDQGW